MARYVDWCLLPPRQVSPSLSFLDLSGSYVSTSLFLDMITSMKFIVLTNNKIAIVDDDRYDALMKFKWRAVQRHGGFYAKTTIYKNGNRIDISMHRFIAKTPYGLVTHHDNRITLDNRRSNLVNMTKDAHDDLHANDNVLIKFDPFIVNANAQKPMKTG